MRRQCLPPSSTARIGGGIQYPPPNSSASRTSFSVSSTPSNNGAIPARSNRSWSRVIWTSRDVSVATKLKEQRTPLAYSRESICVAGSIICGIVDARGRSKRSPGNCEGLACCLEPSLLPLTSTRSFGVRLCLRPVQRLFMAFVGYLPLRDLGRAQFVSAPRGFGAYNRPLHLPRHRERSGAAGGTVRWTSRRSVVATTAGYPGCRRGWS